MRRLRPPTLVSMWMLDVFCCALGCVTLLWLLKTREASQVYDEAAAAAVVLTETQGKLAVSEREAALRLADAVRLTAELEARVKLLALVQKDRDEHARNLALVRTERDEFATTLAVTDEQLDRTKKELAATRKDALTLRARAEELDTAIAALVKKLSASETELSAKKADLAATTKDLTAATRKATDLDLLVKNQEKARGDLEDKLKDADARVKATERKLADANSALADRDKLATRLTAMEKELSTARTAVMDATRAAAGDQARMQSRIDDLEKEARAQRTRLDAANLSIVDLQGTKAKLADKVNQLQVESESRFAGIAMTGKNVVFLVDMSGSMVRKDEGTLDADKWPTVRDTLCKVMRSIPTLEKFQVILFSGKARYLLETTEWIAYEKEKSIERVHKAMTAVKPAEDTNLHAGLEEAFEFREKGLDTVYFFSDGLPTSGPGLTASQERTIANESERSALLARYIRRTLVSTWNRPDGMSRVRVNAIGFFYESPEVGAFLWALARENDGSFVGMSRP